MMSDHPRPELPKSCEKYYGIALLTYAELSPVLRISERKLRYLVKAGAIPHVIIGNSVRFPLAEVEQWIKDSTIGGHGNVAGEEPGVNDAAA